MSNRARWRTVFGAAFLSVSSLLAQGKTAPAPLVFVENRGQWETDARFVLRHPTFAARFHDSGIVLQRERHGEEPLGVAVRMSFENARTVAPVLEGASAARANMFVGSKDRWRSDLRAGSRLRYEDLWPGIDLVVRDRSGEIEYDFELAPGADLDAVAIRCEGAGALRVEPDGGLVLPTALGDLKQQPPITWEVDGDGRRHPVQSRFVARGDDAFGFAVVGRDPNRSLVVDPVILWATYFGATGDDLIFGVDVAANGDVLVAGRTSSLFTFPATPGAYEPTFQGGLEDGFIARLAPTAGGVTQLLWCTFFGGSGNDYVRAVDEGPGGEVAFVGYTVSNDLPTTPGALRSTRVGLGDAFVGALSGNGATLLLSTYVGGNGEDYLQSIAVESDSRIVVCGYATATGLPTSTGAFQTAFLGGTYDGWIGRLDRAQSGTAQLAWGTYFGGSGYDVITGMALSPVLPGVVTCCGYTDIVSAAMNANGHRGGPGGGFDGMVVQFDSAATGAAQKRMSHFIGSGGTDYVFDVGIEANGDVVVAGETFGVFPVTSGSFRTAKVHTTDGFVAKLTFDGQAIRYATYLGASNSGAGSHRIVPYNVAVAADGTVTVVGYTTMSVPITRGYIDNVREAAPLPGQSGYENFVMRLNAPLTELSYSTYQGGSLDDVCGPGGAHVAGDVVTMGCYTASTTGLLVQNPYQGGHQGGDYDGYLLRFDIVANPNGGAETPSYVTTTHTVGTSPKGVALGDVDNDGDVDVLTANRGSNDLTLLRNNGSGAFTGLPTTIGIGAGNTEPTAVARGDLDGDAVRDDVAVVCVASNTVAVIRNVAGTPVVTTRSSTGVRPRHIAIGDLDANGTDDLVVALEGDAIGGGSGIEVSRNGGAFVALAIPIGRSTKIARVVVVDLDGDGDRDVAALAQGSTDEVHLWAGDGAGALVFAGFLPMASTLGLGAGVCVGDLDVDGDLDIAVVQPVLIPPSETLRIYRRTATGSLAAANYTVVPDVNIAGTVAVAAACADLDQDYIAGFGGGPDVVVVNGGSGTVNVNYGFQSQSGAFGVAGSVPVGNGPVDVALADLDGSTTIDIVVVNQISNTVTILRTDGAFARPFPPLGGCAGQGGLTPRIGFSGLPRLGTSSSVRVSLARPSTPALLAFALTSTSTTLGGGCTFYMGSPTSTQFQITDPSGLGSSALSIPLVPSLIGVDAFFQWAIFDAEGAYQPQPPFGPRLSFSDAMRIQVGL